jgi:hypothetical protein
MVPKQRQQKAALARAVLLYIYETLLSSSHNQLQVQNVVEFKHFDRDLPATTADEKEGNILIFKLKWNSSG